ncbi:2-amino-3,7-dideoxy-D-threo-hept-6-ulosonate synthase [Paractinoplanes brasiliensis]|uniref:2-amino-4, 5-dihydroxy-6-oxo-7-(Phosphonooxy)heptanoate synthase n=1 Tax=Paractinoplanes brasiliensis TaxID=52695 RepID=A0A4R6JAG7_9ACTN|nr:2-amino-3,7-dideoxy-D-threo-hept-6-ulosonate synthase [Actinoplanes brasiliensis]TDO32247.1 2-amino-4,5-dihydroxy-6-oxo-7-(phosphonooxy)heptanoate synthase [Actinoplanes brasiliensis]GID27884.1 fructose-bisphosphate aldolase [Actinoplanes brasiliensis]
MYANGSFARRLRLRRLQRHRTGLLVVPLDHAIGAGPLAHRGTLDGLLARLADGGADAVVLHKGAVRRVRPERFREMSLILHLNAGTGLAADPDAKYPVATVAEALRLGAEAVSVHVNVGSRTEDRQIAHLAATAEQCDRWGMPLLAMMYVRGPGITDGRDPARVAHALIIAAELGADLVKTALPDDPAAIARITAACPVPVLAAGGDAADGDATITRLESALRAGASGIAAGRAVFTADDPGAVTARLSGLVHGHRVPVGVR